MHSLLSGLLGSNNTLDNLLLLKKERAKDALTDATGALGATVGTGDSLLTLGEESIAGGSEDGDASKSAAAVTATDTLGGLCSVVDGELATGSADSPVTVGLGVEAVLSAVGETSDHFCQSLCKAISSFSFCVLKRISFCYGKIIKDDWKKYG